MGRLHEELCDGLERGGSLDRNNCALEKRHLEKIDIVEETEEYLIFYLVRHPSADGRPTKGLPSPCYREIKVRYTYRGGGDLSEEAGQSVLRLDEQLYADFLCDDLNEGFDFSGMSKCQIREELGTLCFDEARDLFSEADSDFEKLLDEVAKMLWERWRD